MSSEYRIHKPYVLATLPRPLDHTGGQIAAKEVYGQRDGQRKKRTELAVGIDGETASIYDVRLPEYIVKIQSDLLDPWIETDHVLSHPTSRILHLPTALDTHTTVRKQRCFEIHIHRDQGQRIAQVDLVQGSRPQRRQDDFDH